jgi:hypothetical protein
MAGSTPPWPLPRGAGEGNSLGVQHRWGQGPVPAHRPHAQGSFRSHRVLVGQGRSFSRSARRLGRPRRGDYVAWHNHVGAGIHSLRSGRGGTALPRISRNLMHMGSPPPPCMSASRPRCYPGSPRDPLSSEGRKARTSTSCSVHDSTRSLALRRLGHSVVTSNSSIVGWLCAFFPGSRSSA